jgi:hypothetical protein
MKRYLLTLCGLLALGVPHAAAQIPAGAYRNLGRPAYSCYEEDPTERWWVSAEYLLWWMSPQNIYAPLVTSGTNGVIDDPDTTVAFPKGPINYGPFSGVRFGLGGWWNCERTFGMEVTGFFFERKTETLNFDATGGGLNLFVPFTDATTGTPAAVTLANTATGQTGAVDFSTASHLWGAETNVLLNCTRHCGFEADLYLGIRYVDLTETFNANYTTSDPLNTGITATMNDNFGVRNQFYGGQIGGKIGWYPDRLSVEVIAKIAVGNMHEVAEFGGSNSSFNTTGNNIGGIFTQPSNIGRFTTDNFAVVPQGQLKLNFELFPNVYVGAGYDFLYISRVVRPGLQIDNNVALNQPAGTTPLNSTRPYATFNETEFWAHGISISLQYKY